MAHKFKDKYKEHMTIIMPKGGRAKLYKVLDDLHIPRSKGIREILIAFSEGRCEITPPKKSDMNDLYKHKE